ncbi:MAG TPA: AsmA family protein, partial [Verrucomicrobiae bacterium]
MKKLKKILLIALVAVVVLGLVAVLVCSLFLNNIVKTGIETVAPKITQTTVTVASVNISALSGSAGINGLVVGNPQGTYKSTNAISLGKAAVSVAPGSLLTDKIVVHSVEVNAPEVTLEGNPFGDNNLQKILDNVNAIAGGTPDTNAPAAKPADTAKAGKKLQVDKIDITGVKVTARIAGMEGEPITLTIPDIHLTDLGTGPDGITAADLTKKVLSE